MCENEYLYFVHNLSFLVVAFVLISPICSYAIYSSQFSATVLSQTGSLLAIVTAISVSLGVIGNLVFSLDLLVNKKLLYYIAHIVFAFVFGATLVVFVYPFIIKGLELIVMSLFSIWHHFIYIVRDIAMIVVAWAPIFAKFASKLGFNWIKTANNDTLYLARYRDVYIGEIYYRWLSSYNMFSFVLGCALVVIALLAGILWIICFFIFLFCIFHSIFQ